MADWDWVLNVFRSPRVLLGTHRLTRVAWADRVHIRRHNGEIMMSRQGMGASFLNNGSEALEIYRPSLTDMIAIDWQYFGMASQAEEAEEVNILPGGRSMDPGENVRLMHLLGREAERAVDAPEYDIEEDRGPPSRIDILMGDDD